MGMLRDALYRMEFSPESVIRMGRLLNAEPRFIFHYQAAMRASVNKIQTYAIENAPVLTGTLRRGIRGKVLNPFLGQVGVIAAVPYARRREFGFDGRTDKLGRYFPRDPKDEEKRAHMFYLRKALQKGQPYVNAAFRTATTLAWKESIL